MIFKKVNPSIIPRNHVVEKDHKYSAVTDKNDLKPLDELVYLLEKPYDDCSNKENYINPPKKNEDIKNTFCGT